MNGFYTKNKIAVKKNRDAARVKLQRKGFSNCSKLVGYLFNVFINCQGKILAKHVYEAELCPEGKFIIWRNLLKDKGVIYWHQINEQKWAYFAGPEIVEYVNKEKILTQELATQNELLELRLDHEQLKSKVSGLEKNIDTIINIIDPYTNEEKREKFARGEYKDKFKIVKNDA